MDKGKDNKQQQVRRTPSFVPPGFTPNPQSSTHVTQGGSNGYFTPAAMTISTLSSQAAPTASVNPFVPHPTASGGIVNLTPHSVQATAMGTQFSTRSEAVSGVVMDNRTISVQAAATTNNDPITKAMTIIRLPSNIVTNRISFM